MAESSSKDSWDKVQAIGTILSGSPCRCCCSSWPRRQRASKGCRRKRPRTGGRCARTRDRTRRDLRARGAGQRDPTAHRRPVSSDPQRRRLAISAILIALPEDGPRLVREIGAQAADADVRSYATSALKNRKEQLVGDLYAPEAATRTTAARALVQGWRNDPTSPSTSSTTPTPTRTTRTACTTPWSCSAAYRRPRSIRTSRMSRTSSIRRPSRARTRRPRPSASSRS